MWSMLGTASPWEAHRLESLAMFRLGQSADARGGGVTSFLEKRPPKFPGRVADFADVVPLWPLRPETMGLNVTMLKRDLRSAIASELRDG